jgi:hypothetical protein
MTVSKNDLIARELVALLLQVRREVVVIWLNEAICLEADGVYINAKDRSGRPPIFEPATEGYESIMELLVISGTDPTIPNACGRTALA